jgi:predicted secreted protein
MKKVLVGMILAATAYAVIGCATKLPQRVVAGHDVVRADPAVKPTRATVKIAHEVKIVLRPPKTPGYVWQIAQHNSLTLEQKTDIVTNADGETSVSFLALRNGTTRVLFTLVPPNSPAESQPEDVEDVQLKIED